METVELAHRGFGADGEGMPLVLLHGLLGSSRNWQTAARILGKRRPVFALDLRNHGESPHHQRMDYPAMAGDVRAWLERQALKEVHLLGHSMGGKVAMQLACGHPEGIRSLTVVDIAPRAYPPRWEREFDAMRRMPVERFASRQEAERWLEEDIRDWAFRKFLVSNLERREAGGFRWIVNLAILEASLTHLFEQVPKPGERFDKPVLFLRGGRSRFVEEADLEMAGRFFPDCRLETVPEAGHNVHFDAPEAFSQHVEAHLKAAEA